MNLDKISIKELTVSYHVGVSEAERIEPQRLLVTVEMMGDFAAAALTDDLSKTIDYYAVSCRLLGFGEGRSWRLIEKLAVDIAEMILGEFQPRSVSVGIKKFIITEARYIEVFITRPA